MNVLENEWVDINSRLRKSFKFSWLINLLIVEVVKELEIGGVWEGIKPLEKKRK